MKLGVDAAHPAACARVCDTPVGEPEALRHDQVRFGVPAGAVEPEHDDASRPAPASRANKARSPAKNGLDTPFEMYQKVSPVVGCTKAVTYNHL